MKKKVLRYCIGVFLILMLGFVFKTESVWAVSGGFQVSGTKLYDANGNEFVMRGVNYPHTWYTSSYQTAIPAIRSKGFNCVRIVLSNGQRWTKTSYDELNALISICKSNQLIAILEVHDATGYDDINSLNQAVSYWIEMKNLLQGNEAYVIVNIANEWYGTWDDGSQWKNGYISAIRQLRNAGIKNTLMVDCAGWGQYPKVIFDHGTAVFAADTIKNTMFSIHMYEYAGGDANTVQFNINSVLNKNLCLVVGEFGGYHTNGDVDEDAILSYCRTKNVGWLAWSWHGNSADLSYLDVATDMAGSGLTSFGNRVIHGNDGISSTSSTCSVFTGSGGDPDSNPGQKTKINLFYGSASASNWNQAVSVLTTKNGGPLDLSKMGAGDYFWVEYTGTYGGLELILQSWSSGNTWVKTGPSESGYSRNGNYYAKFYYNDIVNAYGSNFTTVDKVHVGAQANHITVISVDYVY